MIYEDGTIQILIMTGSGLDEDGYPIKSETDNWSNPINCEITPVKNAFMTDSNGNKYTDASYVVCIDEISINRELLKGERVKLKIRGKELGLFSLKGNPEYMTAVCALKIVV